MDYSNLVKRLVVPEGSGVPRRLEHGEIVCTALAREDLADDVAGINASLDTIRRTRGGAWPEGPVTEDYNYVDLVWHEQEFREGMSFSYVVRDRSGGYLGCAYLYPVGGRTPLSEELMDADVDVSFWVTTEAYEAGHYEGLYAALRHWLANELSFWPKPHWSNAALPE